MSNVPLLDFAAKRLQIVAQGRKLRPWVTRSQKHALKVASEAFGGCQRVSTIEDSDVRFVTESTHQAQNRAIGRHFQGDSFACVTQG